MMKNIKMPNFAANLTMMFNEYAFIDRFDAAAEEGFKAVEFFSPYDHAPEEIAVALKRNNLKNVLFNVAIGDWEKGERGLAVLPARQNEFNQSIDTGIKYALALECPNLHVMAGLTDRHLDPLVHRAIYVQNLRRAASQSETHGITLLIEPINHRDMPGYFLNTLEQAHQILIEVNAPNLKIQLDLYHVQITEGDLATKLCRYLPEVGHIQIAGVPGRHEPDIGEINYPYLFSLIDELGYTGWVGCEYRPVAGTKAGLGWMKTLFTKQ